MVRAWSEWAFFLIAIVIGSHFMAQNVKKFSQKQQIPNGSKISHRGKSISNQMYFTRQSLILPRVQPLGPEMGGRVLEHPVQREYYCIMLYYYRCSECMLRLLKEHISGAEDGLRQELRYLRTYQTKGVLVDPFLISCGY